MKPQLQRPVGPAYDSSLSTRSQSNGYTELTDAWGLEFIMPRLAEVSVDCDFDTGYEAQIQFGTDTGQYGPPLPVKLGLTTWDERIKLSGGTLSRVRFRNATAGQNAKVNVEVWGA